MCNFITGVLERSADTPAFRSLVDKYRLRFEPIQNAHITAQLRRSELYFHVTRSYCDCSTNLSPRPHSAPSLGDIKKLRDKGWSQAKIGRWLVSKGPRPNRNSSQHDLLTREQWMSFFDEALALDSFRYVGILMHSYRHSTHDEQFTITQRMPVTTEDLRSENHSWKDDVLYEVVPKRAA